MKLYPHKLGQGSEKIPNPSGRPWTSTLCRDYCRMNPKCVAVDWKAIERACMVHTSPFKRIKATKKYSKHPSSIAQYAKEGKCQGKKMALSPKRAWLKGALPCITPKGTGIWVGQESQHVKAKVHLKQTAMALSIVLEGPDTADVL